jgi:hypothetical protein
MPIDYNEFAKKIKAKYPEYNDVDNYTLASKMVEKYPEYKGQVDLKKKDLTASGLGTSSSDRLSKTTTTKPTASSSSKGEIFTGYPGKGDKPYQFKDGNWYEESPLKVYGQKAQYVQIQDPNRIGNLNKQFKKDASLSQQEEVFNNYDDEKSDNQYRIKDGQWQRMTPGSKWHTIQNEGSINALNNRYGKSVSTRVATTTTVKPVKFDDINSDFMAKTEEDAIKKLTEKYGKLGFEFSEEGLFLKDQIRVKTKDGSKDQVFEFDEKNPEQARELRAFLEANASKPYSESFDKALNSLNKFEGKDQMSGPKMGTGQYGYQQQSAIVRGKNLLSNEFQLEFKKLPFEEQKEIIQEQIIGTGLPTNDIQSFYKSAAYQDYKKKKVGGDQQSKSKQDQIYDDYQYALATKDPAKIKEAKAKIDAYYTDDIIQDNVKTYNMKLNDFEQSQKNILQDRKAYDDEVNRFNELAESGNMTQEQYDAQKKILDDKAESLETRAQNFVMQRKEIQASQNKLNLVAGKYIAAKEKEGNIGGFLVNKVLTGVSMTFAEPFAVLEATGQNFYDQLSPEEKAYYKSIQHNGKNLTREQIENLLANKAALKAKTEAKESIIKTLGKEGTTLEYMKSGDRGFITQAIGGVLESLPAMATGVAGKAAGFVGLAAQAYSGIEEEMLSDPDFQYTSAGDRAIIAIPYAAGMGVLESVGLQNLVKGDSFLGKVMMDVALKSAKKLGANATKEALERVAAKEVESLLAKGLIRVTQAGVAEFETGFTQALVLDQGLKNVYNYIQQSGLTEEQKKNLTQGEYFDTADGFKELASQTFEDGVAEMIGGFTMGSVGTVLQAVVNGNISLYNEDDVKFLNDVVADSNFKKLYVASMKTQMLNGNITKSKAQQNLNNLNEIEAAFDMMPDGLSTADMNTSLSLITERAQLTREKAGKDPNLVAPLEARIKAINEELTKIGENAVQEQATSEVSVQPGAKGGREVAQGKPEAGLKETTKKGKEEVDQYIADMGAEARIGNTINPVMEKMANAEYINDNDIDNAIEAIFNEVESLDKSDYSAETKAALSEKLLNIAEKLDNYEFRTKTETVATTKAGAATTTRRTSEAVQKIRAEKYFDGVQATVNGQEVTLTDNKGRVEAQMPNGEVVVLDTPTMEIAEDGFEFDDNGALQAVTVTDRLGNTAKLTGDQALDFAIRDRENKLGVVEQAEFDTVYQEVEKKYIKETPTTQVAAEEQAAVEEQQPVVEEEAVVEEEKQPVKEPSEANRFTERNAKVMAVKFPKKKGIVKAALNIIKALPGVKIYLHEDSNQYAQEVSARVKESIKIKENLDEAGSYIDGEIHIDMSKADLVTLLHEAFHHAFLTLGVKNGIFIDLAKGLRSLVTDKETLAELDEFIKVYYSDFDQNKLDEKIKEFKLANPFLSEEEIEKEVTKITEEFESEIDDETLIERAEEFAVQLGAILANNREELTTTKLTQFKALINRIAKKIGLGMVFSSAANSKEASDFINTITRGLTTGDIVEGKFKPTKTGKAKRQAVTIMEGKESMKKFGLAPGKNVTRKIGEALEARQRAKYGTIAQKDNSPEARKKISNWMVDEVKYFVQLMGDKSGKGWYGELYQNSLDAMAKVFPEMKTDQNARDLFTMLVAITSDGQKVMSNFRLAAAAYDYYKKNGVMPNTLPGQRVASFEANLKRINELLVEYNGDITTIKEKLMEVKSIEEINKERRREGLEPLSTNWPVSFKAPFAASVFGPKLGMFYSNLSGNESYPTLDRWWSRTFNRYRGTLIPGLKSGFSAKGEAIGLDRFKQLLGNPGMSNEEALLAAKSYRDSYAAKGYKSGTDVEKAANTIYKTAFENLNDAPFTKNDRQFMYDTISDAVNKLNKQGYDLSIADVQAILWYFEKNLYKTLGVQAKIEGISYEDAANYTYDKWKESGNKFDYKINESEEGQAVEDADEDIQEEIIQRKKQLKTKENNKKLPNLAQNEKGNIQSERTGDGRTARPAISKNAPLEGAPTIQGATGPDPGLVSVAEKYADENDIDLKRQGEYVELDEQRAKRIADAYEQMADDPQNPKVKEAYAELIKQTKAQYQALIDAGYKFWFVDVKNPDNIDYISSPYNAMRDLRQNKQMGVFPTEQGFGSNEDMDVSKNPLLEDTGIMWPSGGLDGEMKIVTANDLFRAVHDTFGHGLEGAGFRARGEENAWQAHSRLYTGSAIGAMTSETRGQNSWVNYGPKGEQNRTASGEDTIFADQKVGLMPRWTWTEGRAGDMEAPKRKKQLKPKILGVKPTVVIVNDEQKALVDQIKLEVRAQREQKKAYKQVLADISARVTALKSKGNISVKQFDAIMKNLKRLNFDNETKVQAFIDYVSRALANADYVEKVAKAQSLNKRIKASLKGTANPFAVLAKMFTTLDSRWVQNIDDHIAVAQMILDGVKPSTARRGVLTLKEEPDLQVIAEYIDAEQTLQTKMLLDNLKARYERITGKPSASLDAETMLTELQGLNPTVDQTDNIKQQIDEKLAEYAEMLTDEDPQVIVDAINIDTDIMDWKDAVKILDSLDTYFTNGSLAGIESLVGAYKGIQNVKKFRSKSKPMSIAMSKKLGSTRLGLFAGFSRILERKFRSTEKANMYQNASGINDIITGANRADFEAAKKQKEYIKKFEKVKDFYSNENIYERGVIADLIRTNPGIDQDAEFERLVNILMDSKDMLLASKDNVKVEMGKTYDQVFKKLGLYDADADIESVKAKATKTNIDAVNFVVDMFAEKYDLLSDTAMGVYNIMLGQDINYTPKTYVNDKTTKSKDSDPLGGNDVLGLGAYTNASFNRNEAGVLMPITRPKDIKSNGKYVDLNFDNNMFRSYRLALTDAYTATGIRQLNSFYNSKENEDIIGSEKDFDIIKEALADYINTIKGKHLIDKNLLQGVDKWLNMVSTFGAVRALVGIGQAANQFASGMSNTIVNAGEHIRPSDFTKKAFDFMNRSGQPIANVGENDILISLANFDKSIERATFGKSIAEVGLDKFAKFNAKAFQMMVSNPDAVARRLAWMAYYRKYAIKNKLGPIDFNAEPNVEAAAYAQSMVDRSMDTTDARVRGEVYRSQNTATKILRSVFIPFSSFGMNQRTRMWGDLTKLVTGDANLDTARSLASITAEIYVYNMIRFQMARLILWSAMNLLGYDEEEQDELIEKMKRNMLASSWSKAIVDVVSPLALADNYVLKLSNWVMSSAGIGEPDKKEIDDYIKEENDIRKVKNLDPLNAEQEKKKREDFMKENSMQFYISDEANFGTLGIQWEKMSEAYDILAALKTGKYTNERKQDKYFDKEGMSKLESVALLKMGGVIAPVREFDQIANKSFKLLKDSNTMSEKKNDMIGEVKKKFGKLDPVLEKLAEKKNKLTSIEDEINWINSKERKGGGFGLKGSKEKEEYAKLLDVISQPSADMLKMIQNGKTAQYIIDQELKK